MAVAAAAAAAAAAVLQSCRSGPCIVFVFIFPYFFLFFLALAQEKSGVYRHSAIDTRLKPLACYKTPLRLNE